MVRILGQMCQDWSSALLRPSEKWWDAIWLDVCARRQDPQILILLAKTTSKIENGAQEAEKDQNGQNNFRICINKAISVRL